LPRVGAVGAQRGGLHCARRRGVSAAGLIRPARRRWRRTVAAAAGQEHAYCLVIGCSLIYLLSTLGLGLFVSTFSQTQQQASMTAAFFFLTPMIYLSGFTLPIENMPGWIQWVTYLISAALLPGDRARHLPEGGGRGRVEAAAAGAAGVRGLCSAGPPTLTAFEGRARRSPGGPAAAA